MSQAPLSARVAAATAPDRDLDLEITSTYFPHPHGWTWRWSELSSLHQQVAVVDIPPEREDVYEMYSNMGVYDTGLSLMCTPRHYTSSVDAALTLSIAVGLSPGQALMGSGILSYTATVDVAARLVCKYALRYAEQV